MDTLLELRLETIKSLDNFEYKLLKCFYNGHSVLENYLDRSSVIHVHGLVGKRRFCATFSNNDRVLYDSESSVLVGVGKLSESFRPLATIERLKFFDSCDVFRANSSEIFASPFSLDTTDSLVKRFWKVLDWKLRSLYLLLGIKAGQLIDEVIEGSTEVIDDFADNDADFNWQSDWVKDNICSNRIPFTLIIDGNTIILDLAKGINPSFQVTEVFACPIDPLISAIQRVHMLYYPCGEESGKETKDSEGARDTRAHKERVS